MEDVITFITYISPEGSVIYKNLVERNGIVYLENNIVTIRQLYPHCNYPAALPTL